MGPWGTHRVARAVRPAEGEGAPRTRAAGWALGEGVIAVGAAGGGWRRLWVLVWPEQLLAGQVRMARLAWSWEEERRPQAGLVQLSWG